MRNKKILILSHALELGGVEKSLVGLLYAIDTNEYDVDLFLLRHEGELMKYIPENINLLPQIPEYSVLARPMVATLKEGHILLTIERLRGKIASNRYNKKNKIKDSIVSIEYSHKYTYKHMPKIQWDVTYDFVISFLTPHYIVANKVRAKKKVAWIHTDYTAVGIDRESEERMWSAYDTIVGVSESVSEGFKSIYPNLKDKVITIENILPESLIKKQSDEKSIDEEMPNDGCVKLLSVGRFSYAKNFDNIPEICRLIKDTGIDIKWYLIGYGGTEALIRKKIIEFDVSDNVIILGKKSNPYPYMKACDIYVQPSRYEGKCVSVREAQLLGKPVVITDYPTSMSQLENGVDGLIAPMGNTACAEMLTKVIQDKELQENLIKNCCVRDYSNSEEINKLYKLI